MISLWIIAAEAVVQVAAAQSGQKLSRPTKPAKRSFDWLWLLILFEVLLVSGAFIGIFLVILLALFPAEIAMLLRGWK